MSDCGPLIIRAAQVRAVTHQQEDKMQTSIISLEQFADLHEQSTSTEQPHSNELNNPASLIKGRTVDGKEWAAVQLGSGENFALIEA